MKLSQLLQGVFAITNVSGDTEISDVSNNTARIAQNSVFVCIEGAKFDGHTFAQQALLSGACAVVVSHDLHLENQIIVQDTSVAYARMCANLFGNPSRKLKMIGITGTNGKTSTSSIMRDILQSLGKKTALIGTVENVIGDTVIPSTLTTPDSYTLNSLFAQMVQCDCEYCIMEASSHALKQHRTEGIHFAVGIFTNLTQDHLDYHKTIEDYFFSKCKLFEICDTAVINADDAYGRIIAAGASCPVITYSAGAAANYRAENISYYTDRSEFTVNGAPVCLNIPGDFSVHNGLAAVCGAIACGVEPQTALNSLKNAAGVKGRVERFETGKDFTVLIDYAHTPDGLLKVLETIKTMHPTRIVTLFGCGGDRDKTKRPIMGKIAAENSDFVIVTSDNPRTENPALIIEDIIPGVKETSTPYTVIENRREAIAYAVNNAQKGDVILLAGKGHETYQIIGTTKNHFDEREVLSELLR